MTASWRFLLACDAVAEFPEPVAPVNLTTSAAAWAAAIAASAIAAVAAATAIACLFASEQETSGMEELRLVDLDGVVFRKPQRFFSLAGGEEDDGLLGPKSRRRNPFFIARSWVSGEEEHRGLEVRTERVRDWNWMEENRERERVRDYVVRVSLAKTHGLCSQDFLSHARFADFYSRATFYLFISFFCFFHAKKSLFLWRIILQ